MLVKKKTLLPVVGLVTASSLFFAACASDNEEANEEDIVLDFPTWQANEPGNADVFEAIIEEFETRNPDVEVNMYHVSNEDFIETVLTQLQAGTPPDIIAAASNQYAPFAQTGLLEPLDERLEESGILDDWSSAQDARKYDGNYYALELHGLMRMLHYNEEHLAEAGIDSVPETVSELRDAVDKIDNEHLEDVSVWGATTVTHPNLTSELEAYIIGNGGAVTENGEWTLTKPETIEAVELYRELGKKAPSGQNGAQYRQLMADQKIALAHDGNWVTSFFDENAQEDERDNLKVAPSPFDRSVLLMGTGLGMPKEISDQRKELVWEFIQIAAEPEFQSLWAEYLNAPPGREDAIPDELIEENEVLQVIDEEMPTAVSEWPDSDNYMENFGEIDLAIQDSVMRMLTTEDETLDILQDLESELGAITEP